MFADELGHSQAWIRAFLLPGLGFCPWAGPLLPLLFHFCLASLISLLPKICVFIIDCVNSSQVRVKSCAVSITCPKVDGLRAKLVEWAAELKSHRQYPLGSVQVSWEEATLGRALTRKS